MLIAKCVLSTKQCLERVFLAVLSTVDETAAKIAVLLKPKTACFAVLFHAFGWCLATGPFDPVFPWRIHAVARSLYLLQPWFHKRQAASKRCIKATIGEQVKSLARSGRTRRDSRGQSIQNYPAYIYIEIVCRSTDWRPDQPVRIAT